MDVEKYIDLALEQFHYGYSYCYGVEISILEYRLLTLKIYKIRKQIHIDFIFPRFRTALHTINLNFTFLLVARGNPSEAQLTHRRRTTTHANTHSPARGWASNFPKTIRSIGFR